MAAGDVRLEPAVSLGDFVKQLVASVSQKEDVVIPFEDARSWHLLFYKLKRDPTFAQGRPVFFEGLFFDWDGSYPKSRDLDDCLQYLHWNSGVSARNPGYDRIVVPSGVSALWFSKIKGMPPDYQTFVERATSTAIDGFFTERLAQG